MTHESEAAGATRPDVSIRPLSESDLPAADRIMRLAFGTFLGLPEPAAFMGDADYVRTRWRADPAAAFGAEAGGEIIGSNFATRWGSVAFFGPTTVRPDFWDRGVGTRLMAPVMDLFDRWGTGHAGLFTFADSPKHHGLYQKFGFRPRALTALMSKAVDPHGEQTPPVTLSDMPAGERESVLSACRELTDSIYAGLDVTREIEAVSAQGLGETVLLWDNGTPAGLAVCHLGAGTEAGSGRCYVKFGAVRSGRTAARHFGRLLEACEGLARSRGLSRLEAGVSTAREEACRQMAAHGFATDMQGIAMHRPDEAGYHRPGVFVMDDWR